MLPNLIGGGHGKQKVWNLPLFQHNIGQSVPIRHEYLSLGWLGDRRKKNSPSIYFSGDSGYFRGFSEIGTRFQLDYALMPIGAYEPEWFMHLQHVSPEEAVQAFIDTEAKYMIPTHYGAFMLADDTPKEALDRLYTEWQRREINKDKLYVPKLGEIII